MGGRTDKNMNFIIFLLFAGRFIDNVLFLHCTKWIFFAFSFNLAIKCIEFKSIEYTAKLEPPVSAFKMCNPYEW